MAKSTGKPDTSAETPQPAAIDAQAMLKGLTKEGLAAQIQAKRQERDRVEGEMKALMLLERARRYRDGESPLRRKKPSKPSDAGGAQPEAGQQDTDHGPQTLLERIKTYLANRGECNRMSIAAALDVDCGQVDAVLQKNSNEFRRRKSGVGMVTWSLPAAD